MSRNRKTFYIVALLGLSTLLLALIGIMLFSSGSQSTPQASAGFQNEAFSQPSQRETSTSENETNVTEISELQPINTYENVVSAVSTDTKTALDSQPDPTKDESVGGQPEVVSIPVNQSNAGQGGDSASLSLVISN